MQNKTAKLSIYTHLFNVFTCFSLFMWFRAYFVQTFLPSTSPCTDASIVASKLSASTMIICGGVTSLTHTLPVRPPLGAPHSGLTLIPIDTSSHFSCNLSCNPTQREATLQLSYSMRTHPSQCTPSQWFSFSFLMLQVKQAKQPSCVMIFDRE